MCMWTTKKQGNQEKQGFFVNAAGSSSHSTSDDQTPQTKVSVAMEIPLNSIQPSSSSTLVRQTSELPVLKDNANVSVKDEPGIDEKQSVKEPLAHLSVLPADLSIQSNLQSEDTKKKEASPILKSRNIGPEIPALNIVMESRRAEPTI